MCSANIITSTVSGAASGSLIGGPVGAVIGGGIGLATSAGVEGHGPLGDVLTPPKPKVKVKAIDEKAKDVLSRRRELRRMVAGRPGPGRRSTIQPQGTGSGPSDLKQKLGQ